MMSDDNLPILLSPHLFSYEYFLCGCLVSFIISLIFLVIFFIDLCDGLIISFPLNFTKVPTQKVESIINVSNDRFLFVISVLFLQEIFLSLV